MLDMKKKIMVSIVVVAAVIFIGLQLLPFGKELSNPPVVREPDWDSAATKELAQAACFDCHSNETNWPWYSKVAPVSWLLEYDVTTGRSFFNFSEWEDGRILPEEFAFVINNNSMPPVKYRIIHPESRLTADQKQVLIQGLEVSLGK